MARQPTTRKSNSTSDRATEHSRRPHPGKCSGVGPPISPMCDSSSMGKLTSILILMCQCAKAGNIFQKVFRQNVFLRRTSHDVRLLILQGTKTREPFSLDVTGITRRDAITDQTLQHEHGAVQSEESDCPFNDASAVPVAGPP
jgi:hypothetical protein